MRQTSSHHAPCFLVEGPCRSGGGGNFILKNPTSVTGISSNFMDNRPTWNICTFGEYRLVGTYGTQITSVYNIEATGSVFLEFHGSQHNAELHRYKWCCPRHLFLHMSRIRALHKTNIKFNKRPPAEGEGEHSSILCVKKQRFTIFRGDWVIRGREDHESWTVGVDLNSSQAWCQACHRRANPTLALRVTMDKNKERPGEKFTFSSPMSSKWEICGIFYNGFVSAYLGWLMSFQVFWQTRWNGCDPFQCQPSACSGTSRTAGCRAASRRSVWCRESETNSSVITGRWNLCASVTSTKRIKTSSTNWTWHRWWKLLFGPHCGQNESRCRHCCLLLPSKISRPRVLNVDNLALFATIS